MQAARQSSQVESSRAGPGTQTRNQLLFGRTRTSAPRCPPLHRLHHMTVLQHARCLSELSCCSSITELGLLGAVRLWIPFRLSAFRCVVWVPRQRVCSIVHAPVYCLSVDISMHVSVYLCVCICVSAYLCAYICIYTYVWTFYCCSCGCVLGAPSQVIWAHKQVKRF